MRFRHFPWDFNVFWVSCNDFELERKGSFMGTKQERKSKIVKSNPVKEVKTTVGEYVTVHTFPDNVKPRVPEIWTSNQGNLLPMESSTIILGVGKVPAADGPGIHITHTVSGGSYIKSAGMMHYIPDLLLSEDSDLQKQIEYLWNEKGASQIFRSIEDFHKWLQLPNIDLNGSLPMAYLKSDIEVVTQLLGRLIHGVTA